MRPRWGIVAALLASAGLGSGAGIPAAVLKRPACPPKSRHKPHRPSGVRTARRAALKRRNRKRHRRTGR